MGLANLVKSGKLIVPMPITDESSAYINPILSGLTAASYKPGGVKLQLPGGEIRIVSGVWKQYPNGVADVRFTPKIGTVNLTTEEPASPITTAPSQTRMPANRGLRLGGLGGAASVGLALSVVNMIREYEIFDELAKRKPQQDLEMIGYVLSEMDPALEPLRALARKPKRKKPGGGGNKRIRIHGYSRRSA